MEIAYEDFRKVQIHVGTILSVNNNEKARQPALVLEVDFGNNIGIKTSSAKITDYYDSENLIGRQIIAVCNFPTKNIAGIVSEILILGAVATDGKVVLLHPSQEVENGLEVYWWIIYKMRLSLAIHFDYQLIFIHLYRWFYASFKLIIFIITNIRSNNNDN